MSGTQKEAAKNRRAYLLRKAGTGTAVLVSVSLTVGLCLLTLWAMYAFANTDPRMKQIYYSTNYWFFDEEPQWLGIQVWIVPGLIALASSCLLRRSIKKSKSLVYVPPVRRQLAALPAADILVRASIQPGAAPDELLRAARRGAETEAGELVRAGVKDQIG